MANDFCRCIPCCPGPPGEQGLRENRGRWPPGNFAGGVRVRGKRGQKRKTPGTVLPSRAFGIQWGGWMRRRKCQMVRDKPVMAALIPTEIQNRRLHGSHKAAPSSVAAATRGAAPRTPGTR